MTNSMTVKIKNRHRLKSKEIRSVQNELISTFGDDFFDEKSSVETGNFEEIKIVLIDGEPSFMKHEDKIMFTLLGLEKYKPKKIM